MSLAREIIKEAADHTVPLTTLLRKFLILASRLKNEDMKNWVLGELNGFQKGSKEDLPPHRVFGITAKGFFVGPFGASISDQPLPAYVLDESLRWWATTSYAMQGIAAYEGMIAKDPTGKAMVNWPADLVASYQSKFIDGYALNRAWQEIPISGIAELVDAVRTKVLQLALELENDVGDIDSVIAKGDTEKVAPIVQQVFNTVVYGGTALLGSQAGGSINVIDRQLIVAGDFRSLESQLRATGLEPSQIETLREIVAQHDHRVRSEKDLGPAIRAWITKVAKRFAQEGGKVAIDVAKKTLTAAILTYFGLGS